MALPTDTGLLPLADDVQQCVCGTPIRAVLGSVGVDGATVYLADVTDVRQDRVACSAGDMPTHRPKEAS